MALWTANGYAAVNEHRLQACLSLEVARVLQTTPPPASAQEGFRAGYAKGFDFIAPYEAFIRSMPSYAERFPGLLNASMEAGERRGQNLARESVEREVGRCRQEFLQVQPETERIEQALEQSRSMSADDVARVRRVAVSANTVFIKSGTAGLAVLTENCYAARDARGLDCLVIDRASMFIDGLGPAPLPFFQDSEHRKRRADLIASQATSLGRVTALEGLLAARLPQIMVSVMQAMSAGRCIVHDPDISDSFRGECIDGVASGYGAAKGRDTYVGEFKDGLPHGRGKYTWGPNSRWPTEEYDGWYHKGKQAGFGVKSIAQSSAHPSKKMFEVIGVARGGRLEVPGRHSGNSLEFYTPCATEPECLEMIPNVQFDVMAALGERPRSRISTEDIARATRTVIDRDVRLHAHVSQCIATELVDELLVADN